MEFALSSPEKLVQDIDRNGLPTKINFCRRIKWGINQNQGFSAKCNRQFDYLNHSVIVGGKKKLERTENTPAINAKPFLSLPQLSKKLVVSVAEIGQRTLRNYFGTKALNNQQRNKLFVKQLNNQMKRPEKKRKFRGL